MTIEHNSVITLESEKEYSQSRIYQSRVGWIGQIAVGLSLADRGYLVSLDRVFSNGTDVLAYGGRELLLACEVFNWSWISCGSKRRLERILRNLLSRDCVRIVIHGLTPRKMSMGDLPGKVHSLSWGNYQILPPLEFQYWNVRAEEDKDILMEEKAEYSPEVQRSLDMELEVFLIFRNLPHEMLDSRGLGCSQLLEVLNSEKTDLDSFLSERYGRSSFAVGYMRSKPRFTGEEFLDLLGPPYKTKRTGDGRVWLWNSEILGDDPPLPTEGA